MKKMCVFYAKKRDFLMFFMSKKGRARVRPLVQIKNAHKRAHARAKPKRKSEFLVILRVGATTDFERFCRMEKF